MKKNRILKSVEVLPNINVIQVAWENQIIDDDDVTVLSSTVERCAYNSGELHKFTLDLGVTADLYIPLITWDPAVITG